MTSNVVWHPPKGYFHKGSTFEQLRKFQPTIQQSPQVQRTGVRFAPGTKWKKKLNITKQPRTTLVLPKITKPATFTRSYPKRLFALAKMNRNQRIAKARQQQAIFQQKQRFLRFMAMPKNQRIAKARQQQANYLQGLIPKQILWMKKYTKAERQAFARSKRDALLAQIARRNYLRDFSNSLSSNVNYRPRNVPTASWKPKRIY